MHSPILCVGNSVPALLAPGRSGKEDGQFLCCISRLRHTPFWEMDSKSVPFDPVKHARTIVCRWAEQSSKGVMWRDFGMGEWLFDFDREEDVEGVVPAVLAIARDRVRRRFAETMETVRREVLAACE